MSWLLRWTGLSTDACWHIYALLDPCTRVQLAIACGIDLKSIYGNKFIQCAIEHGYDYNFAELINRDTRNAYEIEVCTWGGNEESRMLHERVDSTRWLIATTACTYGWVRLACVYMPTCLQDCINICWHATHVSKHAVWSDVLWHCRHMLTYFDIGSMILERVNASMDFEYGIEHIYWEYGRDMIRYCQGRGIEWFKRVYDWLSDRLYDGVYDGSIPGQDESKRKYMTRADVFTCIREIDCVAYYQYCCYRDQSFARYHDWGPNIVEYMQHP